MVLRDGKTLAHQISFVTRWAQFGRKNRFRGAIKWRARTRELRYVKDGTGAGVVFSRPIRFHSARLSQHHSNRTPFMRLSRYFLPTEVDHLRGDPSKARKALGWKPKVTFKQLIEMMVRADEEDVRLALSGRPPSA